MRKIRQGKTFWQIERKGVIDAYAYIRKGLLDAYLPFLSQLEWFSLYTWVEGKQKEGRLWGEGK